MDLIVTASASNRVIVLASQAGRGRGRVWWVVAREGSLSSPGFCVEFFRPLSFVLLCVCFLLVAV